MQSSTQVFAYRLDCPPVLCPRAECPEIRDLMLSLGWVSLKSSVSAIKHQSDNKKIYTINAINDKNDQTSPFLPQKPYSTCNIEVRSDFLNHSQPMLEFCSPVEPYPRAGELQQWFLEHETKIMAYLQTVITLLAGAVAKWVIQGNLSCINEYTNNLNTLHR